MDSQPARPEWKEPLSSFAHNKKDLWSTFQDVALHQCGEPATEIVFAQSSVPHTNSNPFCSRLYRARRYDGLLLCQILSVLHVSLQHRHKAGSSFDERRRVSRLYSLSRPFILLEAVWSYGRRTLQVQYFGWIPYKVGIRL